MKLTDAELERVWRIFRAERSRGLNKEDEPGERHSTVHEAEKDALRVALESVVR